MEQESVNCIVCASEFNQSESNSVVFSSINTTNFKICQSCLDNCDPSDNYKVARSIVESYLKYSEVKSILKKFK